MYEYPRPRNLSYYDQPLKRRRCEWRFGPKDVMVIAGVALVMSGFIGIGGLVLVETLAILLP